MNINFQTITRTVGISSTTTWRILHKDMHFHPYKIVSIQELQPNDRVFSDWAKEQLKVGPDFNQRIFLRNETFLDE